MTKQFATPGPRAIHPELCDSPGLGRCGVLANALFPRLIAMADDQGRLVGDPYSVLVQCMGRLLRQVSVDQLEDALAELAREDAVQLYEERGQQYIQIVSWWRWQNGQRRAYPSRWPAPRGWSDLVYGCAAAPEGVDGYEEAVAASPRRNAAIRGIPLQSAANRSDLPPRARAHVQARARAHAVPSTVPSTVPNAPAHEGTNGVPRGGQPERAGDLLTEFQRQVPRPGTTTEAKP